MRRRDFLKTTGAAAVAASTAQMLPAFVKSRRPLNLLFITVDDMNYSMPGFMGGLPHLTPRLDALAARSHRFVNNRTSVAICQPSREAMMTGRLPQHSGGLGFTPVYPGVPTLTTVLKEQGYYTAGIHKIKHMQPPSCFPWDRVWHGIDRNPYVYGDAVRDAIAEAQSLKRPFFVNCNINDPHRPFYGSPEAAGIDHHEEGEYKVAKEVQPEEVEIPPFLEDLPDIRKELAQYANSVQRLDISVGKVLDALAAAHELDNTIVYFSADHGMPFPFSKATVYDSGSRTPALLSWPGMRKALTFHDRTCNIDVLPTLLDLMGVPAPEGVDGRSWMPIIHGQKQEGREFLVTNINSVFGGEEFPARAIQDDRYSLVFCPWSDGQLRFRVESMEGLTFAAMVRAAETNPRIAARVQQYVYGYPLAFYDLQEDPGQRVNLIDAKTQQNRIQRMKRLLMAHMETTQDPQLENFKRLLAGEKPIVPQPQRFRKEIS